MRSGKPEFVVVYGRRRIGKTYLIGEYFDNRFSFRASGLAKGSMAEQRVAFGDRLHKYGSSYNTRPKTWLEAFGRLRELLESAGVSRHGKTSKRVVFIDEMPWHARASRAARATLVERKDEGGRAWHAP